VQQCATGKKGCERSNAKISWIRLSMYKIFLIN
jgi:hypothetical protein